jgi:hypothetical protein
VASENFSEAVKESSQTLEPGIMRMLSNTFCAFYASLKMPSFSLNADATVTQENSVVGAVEALAATLTDFTPPYSRNP